MSDEKPIAPPKVLYSPPNAEVVETFARRVCHQLGTEYMTPDVVDGFSAFLKVAADIQAKYLTRSQQGRVDNAE
jgi:hypothetical protein